MKYSEKFIEMLESDANDNWVNDHIFISKTPHKCGYCREETHFIDVLTHRAMCSDECDKAWWDEYAEACSR